MPSKILQFPLTRPPISAAKKLEENLDTLTTKCEALRSTEDRIRSDLRRYEGYRTKGAHMFTMPVWLDRVEAIKVKLNGLRRAIEEHPRGFLNWFSRRKLDTYVLELIDEVYFLQVITENGFQFLPFDNDPVPAALFSSRIVGKAHRKVMAEIWECLLDPSIGTIGVYGLAGVGKSTSMMNVVDELKETDIFDKIIWVTVSKNSNPWIIERHVAIQVGATRGEILSDKLKNLKKHLFVLDDMWYRPPNGMLFPQPTKENRCKIVVISRFRDVCDMMNADKLVNLHPLSLEEALDLFINKASHRVLDPDIEGIAKEIVNECGGLPISIAAVGHAMRDAQTVDEWRIALADILPFDEKMKDREKEDSKGDMSNLLRFAFSRLKNDTVRRCFLYCAFFPVGYRFTSKQLIAYWMAEDFIYTETGLETAINQGHEILRELQDANMLEKLTERGNEWFTIPDLYRDLAISIMTSEEPGLMVRAGLGLSECPDDSEWVKARQISLIGNQIEILSAIGQVCPRLTTLLLRDNPISHISPNIFNQMPLLQILDFSYTGITELPPSLSELSKLRVLFLQYCTSLKSIPSLEKLKKLQVLNLRGTLMKELPQGIEKLLSLRSLDLSNTIRLQKMEDGTISALSDLQELHMQGSRLCKIWSEQEPGRFKELRCLNRLQILTLSHVGFTDHLHTILHLQGQSLTKFAINMYGSTDDCIEDEEEP